MPFSAVFFGCEKGEIMFFFNVLFISISDAFLVVKKVKLWHFSKFYFYPYLPGPVLSLFLIYKSKQLLATHRTMLPRLASHGAATII